MCHLTPWHDWINHTNARNNKWPFIFDRPHVTTCRLAAIPPERRNRGGDWRKGRECNVFHPAPSWIRGRGEETGGYACQSFIGSHLKAILSQWHSIQRRRGEGAGGENDKHTRIYTAMQCNKKKTAEATVLQYHCSYTSLCDPIRSLTNSNCFP